MTLKTVREIAARIWCDQDMRDQTMDPEAVEKIVLILLESCGPSDDS